MRTSRHCLKGFAMTPEKQIILDVYQDVGKLDAPEYFKMTVRELISKHCQMNGVCDIERAERLVFARQLLARGNSKTVVRDRLMTRYSLSRSQAYRVICDSSQERSTYENQ